MDQKIWSGGKDLAFSLTRDLKVCMWIGCKLSFSVVFLHTVRKLDIKNAFNLTLFNVNHIKHLWVHSTWEEDVNTCTCSQMVHFWQVGQDPLILLEYHHDAWCWFVLWSLSPEKRTPGSQTPRTTWIFLWEQAYFHEFGTLTRVIISVNLIQGPPYNEVPRCILSSLHTLKRGGWENIMKLSAAVKKVAWRGPDFCWHRQTREANPEDTAGAEVWSPLSTWLDRWSLEI